MRRILDIAIGAAAVPPVALPSSHSLSSTTPFPQTSMGLPPATA
jgi:hypothetical protein